MKTRVAFPIILDDDARTSRRNIDKLHQLIREDADGAKIAEARATVLNDARMMIRNQGGVCT